MNATKKLICIFVAGTTLAATAPAFADPGRGQARDYQSTARNYDTQDRYAYRGERRDGWDRYANRGERRDDQVRYAYRGERRDWDRRQVVEVRRPVVIERSAYYAQPAPRRDFDALGPALIIGAVIGSYIFSHQ